MENSEIGMHDTSTHSQFSLLKIRRFLPYFVTQFFGAFNDNVYKNALIAMIAFQTAHLNADDINILSNLGAGLFILPFFILSATAGELADKLEKSQLIRKIKFAEILIMCTAALGFYLHNIPLLMAVLFLMGCQSALFGPVKFSILPQHLHNRELIGGNALVETGTFLAILSGTILGAQLVVSEQGRLWVSLTLISVAAAGYLTSCHIPKAKAAAPQTQVSFNILRATWHTLQYAATERAIFNSILGISWFWFLGATYITQLPNFTKLHLHGNEDVYVLLLALFSVGIGCGSLLCEKLSAQRVELGLVPLGALGLTGFGVDLYFAAQLPVGATGAGLVEYWALPGSGRILVDIIGLGLFGGLFIVPLNALIQQRSPPEIRARILAASNVMAALFMVAAAIIAVALLAAGLSIPQLFLTIAIMNAVVAIYIFSLVPEFAMRFLVWLLINTVYRMRTEGLEKIPEQGPAIVVCNHVSYVDALLLAGSIRRPVRFVMYYKIFSVPVLRFIFKTAKAIPIAGAKEDPKILNAAYQQIETALAAGELIGIFPEGQLTNDGELQPFRPGIENILKRSPVTVIPAALQGLWGSFFSRSSGIAMRKLPRRFWSRVQLRIGDPMPTEAVSAQELELQVAKLRGDQR